MSANDYSVFIVDDDPAVRDSIALLLSLRGFRTAMFATAEDFLRALHRDWRGCVVADIRMPGMSGLDLQGELKERGCELPVIIITAHGEVASARAALLADAVDFLEKPFEEEQLLAAIDAAFARENKRLARHAEDAQHEVVLAPLSARERDVLALVVKGMHNRQIAETLGISPRTVEVHRARLMKKLNAGTLADLIRVVGVRPE